MLQKVLGVIVICGVIVGAFYMLVLSPQNEQVEKVQRNIQQLEFDLSEKKKMVSDLSQYKREVEKLNQDLQRALKLLPNRSEIPSLLQKISSLAKKSGLDILKFHPKPEVPQDFYARVPVQLQLQGSYNEITNFFDAVGKLSRIVNIDNFSFKIDSSRKNAASKKKVLSATCVATTFRFISKSSPRKPGKKK